MGQYCFAGWRLSSSVTLLACEPAGRRARGNAAGGRAGRPSVAWTVGRPTLHGGPVVLRPITATPCLNISYKPYIPQYLKTVVSAILET